MLHGMRVVELLGRDLLGTSIEGSASTFPLTLALPSGRRLGVIASVCAMRESTEGTLLMVALTPTRIEGQPTVDPSRASHRGPRSRSVWPHSSARRCASQLESWGCAV